MQPGFLHFDLRRALKACMMNAAMAKFLPSQECIREAFDSLDLKSKSAGRLSPMRLWALKDSSFSFMLIIY